MQRNLALIQLVQTILMATTLAILACIIIVPFLSIDRNYNVTLTLSTSHVLVALQNPATLSALTNSVGLSIIASCFAILCGSIVTKILNQKSWWIIIGIIAVYCLNPVLRALSYFDLFQKYTPIYTWSAALFGARFSTTILLPALILGIHYLPIYLMRSLFVVGHKTEKYQKHSGLIHLLFVQIPPWVRGFPISFTLFFLLTFFDYWVIQVISGNTVLYWTPLFVQKALSSRAINEAAVMIDIGLLVTLFAYLTALVIQYITRLLWRTLSPIMFMGKQIKIKGAHYGQHILFLIIGIFVAWPWINSLIRLVQMVSASRPLTIMNEGWRSIGSMILLGLAVAIASTLGGLIMSAIFQTNPRRYRWWLPSAYVLALVPEAAYVLLSLFITGSGLLRGNMYWLFFLLTSFTLPMAFFIWESSWGERDQRKLWLLGSALKKTAGANTHMAIKEWRTYSILIFLLMFWLTIDNVFLTDFATGPKWKPLSAVIFNATKRGFSDAEFFTSIVSAVTVSVCIMCLLGLTVKQNKEGQEKTPRTIPEE